MSRRNKKELTDMNIFQIAYSLELIFAAMNGSKIMLLENLIK
jgi:hypothetical protein